MTYAPNASLRNRRSLLGHALVWPLSPLLALAGCASAWPPVPPGPGSSSARQHLLDSAVAQGLPAYRSLRDISLALRGNWWLPEEAMSSAGAAAGDLQLRLLPATGAMAIRFGEAGAAMQLLRQSKAMATGPGDRLWQAGLPVGDAARRRALAVVAELHRLLLLGPIAVAGHGGPVNWAEPETLDGRRCDHLHLALQPGLGDAASDRLSLFIDRDQGLLRRLRVSLTGLGRDGDAPVEVDLAGHRRLQGMVWPTHWQIASAALLPGRPARRWQLGGLEVNRGYGVAELAQAPWTGTAATAPPPLTPA